MKYKLSEIYAKYKIMPTLQQHQIRVASVAKMICDSLSAPINSDGVITACLFHDMGNIIKFDLDYFPEFTQPEGLEYWQSVKDEYVKKYGADEHLATEIICKEIGFPEVELSYLDAIGFWRATKTLESDSLEKKICCYADQRVGPFGVLSIEGRLADGRKRYENKKHSAFDIEQFAITSQALRDLEKQIFSQSLITPESITDETIKTTVSDFNKMS